MSSIRVRQPINVDPPEWTIEWYSVAGDGTWMVLRNGNINSTHTYKWQARLERYWIKRTESARPYSERDAAAFALVFGFASFVVGLGVGAFLL